MFQILRVWIWNPNLDFRDLVLRIFGIVEDVDLFLYSIEEEISN